MHRPGYEFQVTLLLMLILKVEPTIEIPPKVFEQAI